MLLSPSVVILATALAAPGVLGSLGSQYGCNLKLAFTPSCGKIGAASYINANGGINFAKMTTAVIPFGDSWTAMNDSTGKFPPPPAVITGTNPMAGGRASNGPTWTEYLANDTGAPIHPYAVGGAVTDLSIWPTAQARNISISDYVHQAATFLGQNNKYDPASTLYVVFFGINDYTYSKTDGASRLLTAAQVIDQQTRKLISAGARNILTAGVYFGGTGVDDFENAIFKNVATYKSSLGVNVAYVNFHELWSAHDASAEAAAIGYTSTDKCLASDSTTVGACSAPQTTLYWQSGHPTTCTHRLMADYVEYILKNCN